MIRPKKKNEGCNLATGFSDLVQGRRKHCNEIPGQCSGRGSNEPSGPFCRNPTFSCAVSSNCPDLFARTFA